MSPARRIMAIASAVVACAVAAVPAATASVGPPPPRQGDPIGTEHAPPGWLPFPVDDPFYRPPAGYEQTSPGAVLRKREIQLKTYLIPIPVKSYQLLVRTTDSHGQPTAVVSTVILPLIPPAGGRANLLSFQIATDSLGSQCNPSYGLRMGLEKEVTGVFLPLFSGWASVITDYQGPQMQWTAGKMSGHATLDGIRAAQTLREGGLGPDTPTGLWGYSGGGLASAWAAQLQASYAPELNIKGVVASAFTGDLVETMRAHNKGLFAGMVTTAVFGLLRANPDLAVLMSDAGRREAGRIGNRCQVELAAMNPFRDINDFSTVDLLSHPAAVRVARENSPGDVPPRPPVLIQQSMLDEISLPRLSKYTGDKWCARGATVDYRPSWFPGHIGYAVASIPEAYLWLQQRFLGLPAQGCRHG